MGFYNVINPLSMQAGQPEDVSQVLSNFNAIAGVLNGAVDNSNIAVAAAIARSKLDFGAGLTNADIAPGAAIDGSKLATDSVTATQIAANGVGTSEITNAAVTFAKLAHLYPFQAVTTYSFPADTNTRIIAPGGWTVYVDPGGVFNPGGQCFVAPAQGFYYLWFNWWA